MKISVLWSELSGYMISSWLALAALGHDLEVLAPMGGAESNTDYRLQNGPGVCLNSVTHQQVRKESVVADFLVRSNPDVIVMSGWWNPAFRRVVNSHPASVILAVDNPYRSWIQAGGLRLRHQGVFRRAAVVAVPGERGRQLLLRAGVRGSKIFSPLYGIPDVHPDFTFGRHRRTFLFTGQLIERKGIPELIESYRMYRSESSDPLPLTIVGKGPLQTLVQRAEGVDFRGFVQPSDLQALRSEAAFLILPSREDAWPLALVEAANSGMGLLCSESCGSAVEVLRHGWNGRIFASGDVGGLCSAMLWAQDQIRPGSPIPRRSVELAAPYTASAWADQWNQLLASLDKSERKSNRARRIHKVWMK